MTDIQKLKALAEAASPGGLYVEFHAGTEAEGFTGDFMVLRDNGDTYASVYAISHQNLADANYIAAANPATVLDLIAEIGRLRDSHEQVCSNYNQISYASEERGKQIDQLKSENKALRAEAAKWKNESVSDSQTIYSLSCNLAQRTGEVRELAGVVDDLSALTKLFVQRLRKVAPGNDLPEKALDYLKRKGLQGSAMREIIEGRLS